jgi:hypothetical protein
MDNYCAGSQIITQRAKIVGKVSAVLAAVIGSYIISVMIIGLWRLFNGKDFLSEIFFLFVFPIPALAFAGFCLFVAYHAWSNLSVKIVKRISVIAAIVLILIIISSFNLILRDQVWGSAATPIYMIIGGIFYSLCSKFLIKWLGLKEVVDWSRREKNVKRFLWWTAFFVWSACIQVVIHWAPKDPRFTHIPKDWWWDLIIWLAILPIYLIYKLSVRIILRKKPTEINPLINR